ncbi:MAG TPA: hypothetical protein VGO39_12115 [Gaiellaceae bacterium]|jgi:photosystem II stability/assembly factor-like uncharacterized protein|nr:hypothetical protein [Gaiellaceae bacterium]
MRGVLLPAAGLAAVLVAGAGCGSRGARAVPSGFVPLSFTAVSENDYAVLGSAPCASGRCTAIVRTTDGGGSFRSTPAPELEGLGAPGSQATLRYADHDDGFAFVTGAVGALYATHDAGMSWHRQHLESVIAFAIGGGHVYTVTARCTPDRCTGFRFQRSPVSRDAWTSEAMPFTPDTPYGPSLDLSAYGPNTVWLLGSPAGRVASQYDVLARSTDAGRAFTVGEGPCFRDLGGTLAPSSARVVWAVCPTGMMARAARSTDGGSTFSPLRTPSGLVNSARLAPAADRTAMLIRNGAGAPALLTTDAGASWTTPKTPAGATFWAWVGFTDAKTGAALVQTGYDTAAGVETQQLWRTSDGGARWSAVRFR